jgi:hypothetical protein
MMKRSLVAAILALMVLGTAGSAWAFGVGVGYRLPTGDFGDAYDGGFGANVMLGFPVTPLVTVYGDLGYTNFQGSDATDDISVWGFNAGAKVNLMMLYVGGEAGYFTEVDEFSLSPLVGMGVGPLDLSARYKLTGDAHWFDLRASISFGM